MDTTSYTTSAVALGKWFARTGIFALMLTVFLFWTTPVGTAADVIIASSNATVLIKKAINPGELQCLAENIYFEAGNQPELGKVAVGVVTLNRTIDHRFPKSICGVVNQDTSSENGRMCQFSWWCNPKRVIDVQSKNWKESLKVAKKILDGSIPTFDLGLHNILYFHSTSVSPKWKLKKVAQIGDHIFYADIRH